MSEFSQTTIAAVGGAIGELRRLSDEAYTAPTYERCRDIWLEKREIETAYKTFGLGMGRGLSGQGEKGHSRKGTARKRPKLPSQADLRWVLDTLYERTHDHRFRLAYHAVCEMEQRNEPLDIANNRVTWERAQFVGCNVLFAKDRRGARGSDLRELAP